MSAVLDKARELADLIKESDEIRELRDAEDKMYNDKAAQDIIAEFQAKQLEFQKTLDQGEELSEPQLAAKDALEEKMEANDAIRNYFEVQQKVEKLLEAVNMVVTRAISGENECGSGCDSCSSGCC